MLHERENREDLEIHLKQNGKKFGDQCVILMQEMYKGKKLTSPMVEQEYHFNSRRLRDCRQHRPDVVKSCWITDKDGKTKVMQYWIEIPPSPTKAAAIKIGEQILEQMRNKGFSQQQLF